MVTPADDKVRWALAACVSGGCAGLDGGGGSGRIFPTGSPTSSRKLKGVAAADFGVAGGRGNGVSRPRLGSVSPPSKVAEAQTGRFVTGEAAGRHTGSSGPATATAYPLTGGATNFCSFVSWLRTKG